LVTFAVAVVGAKDFGDPKLLDTKIAVAVRAVSLLAFLRNSHEHLGLFTEAYSTRSKPRSSVYLSGMMETSLCRRFKRATVFPPFACSLVLWQRLALHHLCSHPLPWS